MTTSAASGARYGVTSMVAPLQRVLVRRPALTGRLGRRRLADPRSGQARTPARGVRRAARRPRRRRRGRVRARRPGRLGLHARPADPQRPRRHPAADGQARADARAGSRRRGVGRLDVPVLGTLDGDAFADGGDRFWLDDTTAAVGLGYRTNRKGAARLQELLEPEGIHVETYDMVHDEGPTCPASAVVPPGATESLS